MKPNERLHALKILSSLLERKSSLSVLMPRSTEVAPLTKEICFGFCRHFIRLEVIANCLVDKRPKEQQIWLILLIGLYQLHYMNSPEYAVVKETVALVDKIKKSWAKALVNAVLRRFCREKEALLSQLAENSDYKYGQPSWLLERLKKAWPMDWQEIASANDDHPPMTLRVNIRKNSVSDYLERLEGADIKAVRHSIAPEGITLASPCDVYELPGFADGCVSVQDAAAQMAIPLLSLKPGLRLLDACCAPGGKLCHILEHESNLSACIGLDVDINRLKRVQENLNRLQLEATLIQGDASLPKEWWDGQLFDRILLDAPCSALGVIRRHSDIKLLRTPEELFSIIQVQQKLLKALWPLLSPGGILVYATCSLIPEENEQQIAAFVANQADCQSVSLDRAWGRLTGHGQQILPGEKGMDGFFYSVLTKG